MVGIRLSNNMDCNYICKLAQEVINSYIKTNGANDNLMLVLQIQEVRDGELYSQPILSLPSPSSLEHDTTPPPSGQ
jgi:hypothetical protein